MPTIWGCSMFPIVNLSFHIRRSQDPVIPKVHKWPRSIPCRQTCPIATPLCLHLLKCTLFLMHYSRIHWVAFKALILGAGPLIQWNLKALRFLPAKAAAHSDCCIAPRVFVKLLIDWHPVNLHVHLFFHFFIVYLICVLGFGSLDLFFWYRSSVMVVEVRLFIFQHKFWLKWESIFLIWSFICLEMARPSRVILFSVCVYQVKLSSGLGR